MPKLRLVDPEGARKLEAAAEAIQHGNTSLLRSEGAHKVALDHIRRLVEAGIAGVDHYAPDEFIVDGTWDQNENAGVALDILGAKFLGNPWRGPLRCQLPTWLHRELRLDGRPDLVVPLASRGLRATHPALTLTDTLGGAAE